jgi:transposase-like protein
MDAKIEPKSLQQAIRHFSDEQVCIDTVARLRWPESKPTCPACGHQEHYYLKSQKRWKCKECYRQFSVKLGTIFEDSAISLDKWLVALWMIVNCRNGVSSYEVGRTIGITQKSAWFVLHRLRFAMRTGSIEKMGGGENSEIEVDETFVGGKLKNMHESKRRKIRETLGVTSGSVSKTAVMGFFDREQRNVRTTIIPNTSRATLQAQILKHVADDSNVYTDEAPGYTRMPATYVHEIVNHAQQYVRGCVHTNSLENFWSLLKRGLNRTYVAVEPFHLHRYLDEQAFLYNNRKDADGNKLNDAQRFELALSQIAGKRLTFAEVTGKVGETAF